MKFFLFINLVFSFALSFAAEKVDLFHKIEKSPDPLTIEKAWELEPEDENPARIRWAIDREIILRGMSPVESSKKEYGIEVRGGLYMKSIVFLKAKGAWSKLPSEFVCSKKRPESLWIGSEESNKWLADQALVWWENAVRTKTKNLLKKLSGVRDLKKQRAILKARLMYREWLIELEKSWNIWRLNNAPDLEWGHLVAVNGISLSCKKLLPESLIDLPMGSSNPEKVMLPLKSPGRFFTAKVNVDIGDRRLNGRFLIDFNSKKNRADSSWLSAQGIEPRVFSLTGFSETDRWRGKSARLPPVLIDRLEMSGFELPFKNLWVGPAEVWMSEDAAQTCCAGVLGEPFFRSSIIYFKPGEPLHFKLWQRSESQIFPHLGWTEIFYSSDVRLSNGSGGWISRCTLEGASGVDLVWEFFSEQNIKSAKKINVERILECGTFKIKAEKFGSRYRVTMDWLNTHEWAFDISHGRVWSALP
jgi:hypothetical protein